MNVMTACNSTYSFFLQPLVRSVRKFYDKPIVLYDLGLTDSERAGLDAEIIPIKDVQIEWTGREIEINHEGKIVNRDGAVIDFKDNLPAFFSRPRGTFKPFCIGHYFQHHNKPVIWADVDTLFTERVEEKGFDVGVTLRPRNEMKPDDKYWGLINTGVMFFNNYNNLVEAWMETSKGEELCDQGSINRLLDETVNWDDPDVYGKVYDWHGVQVKIFDIHTYNDYHLKDGKIWHFKKGSKTPEDRKKWYEERVSRLDLSFLNTEGGGASK